MNAEIDIDSIVFCSLGEVVTFLIFVVLTHPTRRFSNLPQGRHPEQPTCLRQVKSEMNVENRY
jgi:hypothetical protein